MTGNGLMQVRYFMVQVAANCTGFLLDGEEAEWTKEKRAFKDMVQLTH